MFTVGRKVRVRGLTYPLGGDIIATVDEVLPHAQYRCSWTTYPNGEPLKGEGVFPEAIMSEAGLIAAWKPLN